MDIKLSPRLEAIYSLVRNSESLVDIGSDHGHLVIAALIRGKVEKALATDINEAPLKSTRRSIARWDLEDRISTQLCDGLTEVAQEYLQQVVMAGMGGITIRSLLTTASELPAVMENCQRFVLQPMNHIADLRMWLSQQGWTIEDEAIAKEKKHYYQVIAAKPGEVPYTLDWVSQQVGPCNILRNDEDLYGLVRREISLRESVLAYLRFMGRSLPEREVELNTDIIAFQEYFQLSRSGGRSGKRIK